MDEFRHAAREAAHAMRAVFPATPLQRNDHLSAKYDADIWLKREDLTPVRSYKLRGAFNAMRKVLAAGTRPVFVSPGHRINLRMALEMTLAVYDGYRIPKPTRVADTYVGYLRSAAKA